MDQSFGAFLLRVHSINLHATLIARHPLSFSLSRRHRGNFAAGLNSGILDTKQTEAGAFHFGRRRLSGWVRLREIECDLVSTRQRRGEKGLSYLWRENEGAELSLF